MVMKIVGWGSKYPIICHWPSKDRIDKEHRFKEYELKRLKPKADKNNGEDSDIADVDHASTLPPPLSNDGKEGQGGDDGTLACLRAPPRAPARVPRQHHM